MILNLDTYIFIRIEVPAPRNTSLLFGVSFVKRFDAAVLILLRRSNFALLVIELYSHKLVIFITLVVNKLVFLLVVQIKKYFNVAQKGQLHCLFYQPFFPFAVSYLKNVTKREKTYLSNSILLNFCDIDLFFAHYNILVILIDIIMSLKLFIFLVT